MRTVEIAPYCLRKHGRPEDQSEDTLVGRMNHMLNIFCALEKTKPYQKEKFKQEFWKMVIWHLRRYLYLDVANMGIIELRKECLRSEHSEKLRAWILSAQKNWKDYGVRWDEKQSRDYRYLLDYIIDGNLLKYKIKNKLLWR